MKQSLTRLLVVVSFLTAGFVPDFAVARCGGSHGSVGGRGGVAINIGIGGSHGSVGGGGGCNQIGCRRPVVGARCQSRSGCAKRSSRPRGRRCFAMSGFRRCGRRAC